MRNQKKRFIQMLQVKYPNAEISYRINEIAEFKNGKKVDCSYQYVFVDKKSNITLGKFTSDINYLEDFKY